MFAIGLGSTIWYMSRVQSNLIETMALDNAALYSQALAEFRTLYAQEVVERVRPQGIQVTHDYETVPGSIPLPATLSILLGKRIGEHASGAEAQLYSPYPFPWREASGGLRDDFSKEAWTFLSEKPHGDVFSIRGIPGASVAALRHGGLDADGLRELPQRTSEHTQKRLEGRRCEGRSGGHTPSRQHRRANA